MLENSLFQLRRLSPKRKKLAERDQSKRLRDLSRHRIRSHDSYLWKRLVGRERAR